MKIIRTLEPDAHTAVNLCLKYIGNDHQADRACIFELDYKHNVVNNTYEWCALGGWIYTCTVSLNWMGRLLFIQMYRQKYMKMRLHKPKGLGIIKRFRVLSYICAGFAWFFC